MHTPVARIPNNVDQFAGLTSCCYKFYALTSLEIRSVERGICFIPKSTYERTVKIIMDGCIAHARDGHISTSALKSDVTIVFLDPDFLNNVKILAIHVHFTT